MLISTDQMVELLGAHDLSIVDVRSKMDFFFGHLPGAVRVGWREFADPNSEIKGFLDPNIGRIEEKLGSLGISNDRQIVVYSDAAEYWGADGRVFWMLLYLGHDRVRVLDGGWPKWKMERRPIKRGPVIPMRRTFRANPTENLLIRKDAVAAGIKNGRPPFRILDARSPKEFDGSEPEKGVPRAGHIPTAVNIPFDSFFRPDGSLMSPDEIRAHYESKGIRPDDEVVVYCTGGVRSSWLFLTLRRAGYRNVKNYIGSWWEWSRDNDLPVER